MHKNGRSTVEWLLMICIAGGFLWPFIQLWSVRAVPLFDSDTHQKAASALVNLMEEALAAPQPGYFPKAEFKPLREFEAIGLEGKTEKLPHQDYPNMVLLRAQVRWGKAPFRKYLTLETAMARVRP